MEVKQFDIIDVRAGLEAENAQYAEKVRSFCREHQIFLINLMASPGGGKTTVLCRLINALRKTYSIGVIEADVDSDVDARTVAEHGAQAVQLHTGGSCHMDARMTLEGLRAFSADPPDLIVLENIGNLVCPAEFDVGADLKLMILSVPEGDDKPLKYPLMFTVSDGMIINKIDAADIFDFDYRRCTDHVRALNPDMPVFPLSGKTGEGFAPLIEWLMERIHCKDDGCSTRKRSGETGP